MFRYQIKPEKCTVRENIIFAGSWLCYDLPWLGLLKVRANPFTNKKRQHRERVSAVTG